MHGFDHTVLLVPIEILHYMLCKMNNCSDNVLAKPFKKESKCMESVPHPPSMKVEQTHGKKLRAIKIHAIKIQTQWVWIVALACNFSGNFSCATRKFLTKLHSLKAPLKPLYAANTEQFFQSVSVTVFQEMYASACSISMKIHIFMLLMEGEHNKIITSIICNFKWHQMLN